MTTDKNNSIIKISSDELVQYKNKFKSIAIYNEEIYESEVVELVNEANAGFGALILKAETTEDKKGLILSPDWINGDARPDVTYTWKALAPNGYTDLIKNEDKNISLDNEQNTLTIIDQTQLTSAITITVIAYKQNIFVAQSTPYTIFEKGVAPTIAIDEENNQWIIDGELTGVQVTGDPGHTPVITVGVNGNWFVDGKDTNQKAQGEKGKDGDMVEYVYYRAIEEQTNLSAPSYDSNNELTSGWTESPQGITSTYKYEYMSQRIKTNEIWGSFSKPIIWSRWGDKGQDGDGVSYEYYLKNDETPPTYNASDEKWTDEPTGVSKDNRYEYVVQIKTTTGEDGKTKVDVSNAALWAKWSEDGNNGATPYIGEDHYWYINGVSLGIKAKGEDGEDGVTPTVSINDDGYWVINGTMTDVSAQATNYTNLLLSASSQTFINNPNNNDPITPSSITLTAHLYGDLVGKEDEIVWKKNGVIIPNTTGTLYIVNNDVFDDTASVEYSVSIDDYDDEFTIYLLTEGLNGTDGAPGGKGDPGDNAISAFLTDASISFSADKDGYVTAGIEKVTTVKIFNGATEVSGVKITEVTAQSGFTYDYTTDIDTLKITTDYSQLGSKNSCDGQITITAQATINGIVKTFTLGLSWDKTNTGATGEQGPQGSDGLGVKPVNTRIRTQPLSWWRAHGLPSNTDKNWTTDAGQGYVNTHLNIGDTAYISGIATYGDDLTMNVVLYGKVENVTEATDTANGAVVLASLYLIEGGEKGEPGNDGETIYLLPSVTSITKTGDVYSPSSITLDMIKKSGDNAPVSIGITTFKYSLSVDGVVKVEKQALPSSLDITELNANQSIVIAIYDSSDNKIDVKTIDISPEALAEYVLYNSNTALTIQGMQQKKPIHKNYANYLTITQDDNGWYRTQTSDSVWQSKKSAYPSTQPDIEWGAPMRISGVLTNYTDLYNALDVETKKEGNTSGEKTGIYTFEFDGQQKIGINADVIKSGAIKIGGATEARDNKFYADMDPNESVYIAGWEVTTDALISADGVVSLAPQGSSGTINGHTASNWVFNANNNFGVTTEGNFYATAGKIGELTIGELEAIPEQVAQDIAAASSAKEEANVAASAANQFANDANAAKDVANTAANAAQSAKNEASSFKDQASEAAGAAESARNQASNFKDQAIGAADEAGTARDEASDFKDQAKLSADSAADSSDLASRYAASAEAAKGNAVLAQQAAEIAAAQAKMDFDALDKKLIENLTGGNTALGDDYVISPYIGGGYLKITNAQNTVLIDPAGVQKDENQDNYPIFQVISNGITAASIDTQGNATFAGTIQATKGNIGNWQIDSPALKDVSGKVYLNPDGQSATVNNTNLNNIVINANDKFAVTKDGAAYASAGKVAGWTINEKSISKDNVGLTTDSIIVPSLVESNANSQLRIFAGGEPKMKTSVIIYFNQGEIINNNGYQTKFSADINIEESSAVNEEDVTIISSLMYGIVLIEPNWDIIVDNTSHNIHIEGIVSGDFEATSGKITVEYFYTSTKYPNKFMILEDGSLYAKDTKIEGEINATRGKLGNIQVFNDGLYIDSDNAKVQIGNVSLFCENNQAAFIKTSGPLTLMGENNTAIAFMPTENNTLSQKVSLKLYATRKDSKTSFYILADKTLWYSKTIIISWLEVTWTGDIVEHPLLNFAIEAGAIKSNTQTIDYLDYDSELRFNNGSFKVWVSNISSTETEIASVQTITETKFAASTINITGDVIPSKDKSYKLGNANNKWSQLYVTEANIDGEAAINGILTISDITYASTITTNGSVYPQNDGQNYYVGLSNNPWKAIYAKTSSIQSSDRNQKNSVQPLANTYEQIFNMLKPVSYKFNQNNNNRTHIGFIAQDVKKAIEDAGLTTQDFAAYCEWENDDGSIGCGLRYSEFIALCVDQIQKLKAQTLQQEEYIYRLEERLDRLEQKLL